MTLTQICPPHGVEPNMTNVGTIARHVVLFQTTPLQGDVNRKIFHRRQGYLSRAPSTQRAKLPQGLEP
jgi:hypothetical protein